MGYMHDKVVAIKIDPFVRKQAGAQSRHVPNNDFDRNKQGQNYTNDRSATYLYITNTQKLSTAATNQWRCGAPGAGGADIYKGAPPPTKFNFCMLAARIYVHTSHVIYRKLSRSFLRANDKEWCTYTYN